MALRVIGAGFGRTGTESLKAALEELGFGPCDHMFELLKATWRVPHLEALERGEAADLDALFAGFGSAVDFPFAKYYRELMVAYPEAKVILTVRDPDSWYESARKTILRGLPPGALLVARTLGIVSKNARGFPRAWAYVKEAIFDNLFEGKAGDREFMIARYSRWNEEVQKTVPAERLLVFEVKDGYQPLCDFLGVDVPDKPFPHTNAGKSFKKRTGIRGMVKTIAK